jgi:hypothetical protein
MSTALSIVAQNTGASEEEISTVLSGMIISAKNQHGSKATGAEMAVVTGVCAKYGLNPLVKECAAFISGGKLSVVVMIDGWYKMVNRQSTFDGVEFDDHLDSNGQITAITCKMYIKDRSRPVCVTEYMNECVDSKSSVWKRWPARMLRHKAYIQAARIAFGISEVIDDDEKTRITSNQPKDITPKVEVDFDAINKSFAECGDDETLRQCASGIREELQKQNAWDGSKAKVAAMRMEHKNRIEAMLDDNELIEQEAEQQEENDIIDVEFDEVSAETE